MDTLLRRVIGGIQNGFGRSASLLRVIERRPELRVTIEELPRVLAAGCVARWHEWGAASALHWPPRARGWITGWRYQAGRYSSFHLMREEFAHFGYCRRDDEWECDIQDVVGLSASKSDLASFSSLDAMVEMKAPELIDPVTEEKLRENLAWREVRILKPETSDFFARYVWDGRLFLINAGGSHHFAAARYLAARLGTSVPLRGTLRTYGINEMALASLQRDYEMFVIGDTPCATNAFREAMARFRATYLWQFLPLPYTDTHRAILLPVAEPRSATVAHVLRGAGFFDLGAHLRGMCAHMT
ncbi:DUF6685 family protein [Denitromonas iodatirespirans]|uniref:Uncharacterized protein n=1 Tax=Denitromonas iodatirespirans TaxID=2795389 RepID=A0A944D834_DENI1|nr:DUF6685 family protein [Denitromonas iodatirespirans]MBT0960312.1 hypothetical protein [Denitromonas iodatirespirans]